jgi:hypothetical protein
MSHPFEVGKMYRNRAGEYVVVHVEGDKMKIRYVDGGTLETDVAIQARIWENIQFEDQMKRAEERQRLAREARLAARRRTRRARAEPKFAGFQSTDFEPKKRGIAWSSRKELGKVLAYELSQRTKRTFGHWIVPRQPRVHVASKDHYEKISSATIDVNAALFVAADQNGIICGFRVTKPDDTSDTLKAAWPWTRFLESLGSDDKMQQALQEAMESQELVLDVHATTVSFGQVSRITLQDSQFLWQQEEADQEVTQPMDWDSLVEALVALAPGKRCALYLRRRISAEDCLKGGSELAGEIADIFEALVPLYDASVNA